MIISNKIKRLSFIVISMLLLGCNTDTKKQKADTLETTVINNASNNTEVNTYNSKQTKADKKKYYDNNNNVVYEIKYKPDAFKLRTPSSSLLWKIKLYETKIKISDNEENLNPYEIKIVNPHEAKLVKGNTKIARTTYNLNSQIQTIKYEDKSRASLSKKMEYSPIVMLVKEIKEMPNDQQQIIISELKAKGY